jgi:hypothetical protein
MQRLTSLPIMSAIVMSAIVGSACSRSETSSSSTSPSRTVTATATPTVPAPPTSAPPVPTQTLAAVATTAVATSVEAALVSTTSIELPEDELVRFVAAVETVLEGTALEGAVYNAPEIYIAIAQAACASFTAGESFDDVSADLLTELRSSNPDDDNRLVGAILGAATQTLCPEHANLI